jgi:hypothetical protein
MAESANSIPCTMHVARLIDSPLLGKSWMKLFSVLVIRFSHSVEFYMCWSRKGIQFFPQFPHPTPAQPPPHCKAVRQTETNKQEGHVDTFMEASGDSRDLGRGIMLALKQTQMPYRRPVCKSPLAVVTVLSPSLFSCSSCFCYFNSGPSQLYPVSPCPS